MYFCLIYVDLKEIAVFSMQNVYLKKVAINLKILLLLLLKLLI